MLRFSDDGYCAFGTLLHNFFATPLGLLVSALRVVFMYVTATFRVKSYSLDVKHAIPDYIGFVKSVDDECFRDFRLWLKGAGIMEWTFNLWNNEEHSCIKEKAKGFSSIDYSVYVICTSTKESD